MAKEEGSSKKKHKKHHQEVLGDPISSKSSSKKHKEQQQSTPPQPAAAAMGGAAPAPGSSSEHKHKEKKKKKKHHQQQQQQDQQQQQQQPASDSKVKKKRKQPGETTAHKQPHKKHKQAAEHLTVNIQVPSAAAGSSKKTSKQQQQQQVASAGPWLVYMAAPDPSVYSKLQFKAYVPGGGGAAGAAGGRGGQQQQQQQGMVLVSEQEGTTLIGSTRSSINEPAAQFGSYAVGVFDKRTNTLQLAQPAGGSVVRVEALASQAGPVEVAALSRAAQHSMLEHHQQQQQQRQPERDAAARRAEAVRLVEAFGSTRRKRQLQARAEGTVVVQQNAAAAELDVLMQEVQARAAAAGDTREEIMGRLAANRVIPVHNPLATTPQEAYQPRLMFGEALMSAVNMGQMLHAAENADDADKLKTKVPAYVVQRLQRIREAGSNQAERKRRARLLALLAALIRLATARPKLVERPPQPAVPASAEGGEGSAEGGAEGGEGASTAAARPARPGGLEGLAASLRIGRQQVLELLLDKFYDKRLENGRVTWVREAKQEQLLLMHLLVVALDLEGWRMTPQQFELLRRELKTTPQDLVSRFRELGCSSAAVRIQAPSEDGAAAAGSKAETTSSYNITLLASGDKNLAQSFPRPKVMKKQGAR